MFAIASVWLAIVDVREHRLPNRLLAWSTGSVALLLAVSAGLSGMWPRFGWAILSSCIYGVVMLCLWRIGNGALGAGDVKLAPLIGIVAGWFGLWAAVLWVPLAIALVGVVAGLAARRMGRRDFAFGPSMLLGCCLGLGAAIALG